MNRLWYFDIQIKEENKKAVYIQITDAIIAAIKNGRLKPQEALPSTRKLATIIGVNRNTVLKALDILIAEGWLISKDRIGIFAASVSIQDHRSKDKNSTLAPVHKKAVVVLDDGVPNTQIAPIKELASAYRRVFSLKSRRTILGYTGSLGGLKFRAIIAQMLNHRRGMQVSDDEICITRGSQMALYLTAQCLLTEGDLVLVESPGYRPASAVFINAGAQVMPIEVDQDGIVVEKVEQAILKHSNIQAIYLTPHHQYPTTVTLSLKRRLRLAELAQAHNFIIIEDDYDHEFHFDNRPILPIASYMAIKHYIYIGTFSKIVAPALRVGYLVASSDFIQKVGALRTIIDVQNDPIMEQAIVELVREGAIKRHIKRAAKYYKDKRQYFEGLLKTHLGDKVDYTVPTGGLAFWVRPKKEIKLSDLVANLEKSNLQIKDISNYNSTTLVQGLRLGYGSIEKEELEMAILQLSKCL
ncbi:MocR-like pyridoxine biosynthesis transcription factor PdxR [Aureispira anguillae]|nr:PLP-dependent aminotransferase family protein [Aureispira anguillae]